MKRYYFGALLLCLAAPACNRQQPQPQHVASTLEANGAEYQERYNPVYSEAETPAQARSDQALGMGADGMRDADSAEYEKMDMPLHQGQRATAPNSTGGTSASQQPQSAAQARSDQALGVGANGMRDADSAEYEKMDMPLHQEQRATASNSSDVIIDTGRGTSTTADVTFGNPPGALTGPGTTKAVSPTQGTSSSQVMGGEPVVDESAIGRNNDLQQGKSEGDRLTTQRIRRAIRNDDALSYTAKNVQVTTKDGNISLRGLVMSDKERWQVERLARGYAGSGKVDNYLAIKGAERVTDGSSYSY
ncbi:MAG: BON domain-containing protein [Myxococcales bacterium]